MNDDLWTPEELAIFDLFSGRCGVCRIAPAVTLHEIFPKSMRPDTWREQTNRLPVCDVCHNNIHKRGINYRTRQVLMDIRLSVEPNADTTIPS